MKEWMHGFNREKGQDRLRRLGIAPGAVVQTDEGTYRVVSVGNIRKAEEATDD